MSDTRKIRALPRHISDKIAAGEVVERPLSIVKELLENAVDAGADSIVVEIRNGGKSYIRVTDNGSGIREEDADLVFLRYATSKIESESDLEAIGTLGFRGEALASIAAVSCVELITKTSDAKTGIRIRASGGDIEDISKAGAEEGTTVIVTDLFYNTPARREFMRTDGVESAAIVDYLSKMAIAYPAIRLRLSSNGTILFSTRGRGDVVENILTVYSKQTALGLLSVASADEERDFRIRGLISRPDAARGNRKFQIYFVNGRWIRSSSIDAALADAYSDKLDRGRFPAAFLFLDLPPSTLDVNIHPNKTEIRFLEEVPVREFIARSIRKSLLGELAAAPLGRLEPSQMPKASEEVHPRGNVIHISSTDEDNSFEQVISEHMSDLDDADIFTTLSGSSDSTPETQQEIPSPERFQFSTLSILGTIFGGYILAGDADALIVVDAHAAHERVLYEEARSAYGSGGSSESQLMMTPWIVEIPLDLVQLAPGRLTLLQDLGYDIDEFGPKEFIIRAIPAYMTTGEAESFAQIVLNNEPGAHIEDPAREADRLIMQACRDAVKVTKKLETEEIRGLFRALDLAENPFHCPHGRPTFLKLSLADVEKMFGRTR